MYQSAGLGLIGRKVGMSRVFSEDGRSVPVTVVQTGAHQIKAVKQKGTHGYDAVVVEDNSDNRVEFRLDGHSEVADIVTGAGFDAAIFSVGQKVDVRGRSRGKGFQGSVKRWNFSRQDMTHGNSLSHRAPGSIGQCQTPGRVWKGKKMAGHMGNRNMSVQNLSVVAVDTENELLLIKGAVPGHPGSQVLVVPAVKSQRVSFPELAAADEKPSTDPAISGSENEVENTASVDGGENSSATDSVQDAEMTDSKG